MRVLLILFSLVAASLAQCVYEEPCDDYPDRLDRTGCRQFVWYDEDLSCNIEYQEWMDKFPEIAGDDDLINEEEFTDWWIAVMVMCPSEAANAWSLSDLDGDGYLTETDYSNMFGDIDVDGSGVIDGDEFAAHWNAFYPLIVDESCTDGF